MLSSTFTLYAQNTHLLCYKKGGGVVQEADLWLTVRYLDNSNSPGSHCELALSVFVLMDGCYPTLLHTANLLETGPYLAPTVKWELHI